MQKPTMLTARDLQELIHVDKSTIYRMADSGALPALKIGRQWRFPADEIADWLAERGLGNDVDTSPSLRSLDPAVLLAAAELVADLYGVMVVIADLDGTPLTAVANPCGFYGAIEAAPGVQEACRDAWKRYAEDLDFQPTFTPSRLGFLCARSFIRSGAHLVGMMIIGGVAPEEWPPTPDALAQMAGALGVPMETLTQHIDDVHRLDEHARGAALRGLPRVGSMLSKFASAAGSGADSKQISSHQDRSNQP